MIVTRFFRLRISQTPSNAYVGVAELALLDANGDDITTGGIASASSAFALPAYVVANAFDKDPATSWLSAGAAPQTLGYEFPALVEIAGVRVVWMGFAGYSPSSVSAVTLEWSSDGAVWRTKPPMVLVSGTVDAGATALFAPAPGALRGVLPRTVSPKRDYRVRSYGSQSGVVQGTTSTKATPANTPLRARVRLIRERDGVVVREMWSHPTTGAWRFEGVGMQDVYTALTYHPTRGHRAVVADGLVPEEMP